MTTGAFLNLAPPWMASKSALRPAPAAAGGGKALTEGGGGAGGADGAGGAGGGAGIDAAAACTGV